VELLSVLVEHPRISLGKSVEVEVTKQPYSLDISATLESTGEILLKLKNPQRQPVTVGDWVWRKPAFQPLKLSRASWEDMAGTGASCQSASSSVS
jgi:hypothetical protein